MKFDGFSILLIVSAPKVTLKFPPYNKFSTIIFILFFLMFNLLKSQVTIINYYNFVFKYR